MKSRILNFSAHNFLVAFLFIALCQLLYVRLDSSRIEKTIDSDGVGYYDYLFKTFITRDYPFNLSDAGLKSADASVYAVNKFFFGESLALLPFFLTADFLTQTIRPEMRDGFSSYYQISIALAALFYMLLGFWMVIRLLRRMQYSEEVINTILVLLFLGSNLYFYALHEVGVSHVYSFAIVAFFIDQLHLQTQKPTNLRWVVLAFLLAWITLIRPVNCIIVLAVLPLAGSWNATLSRIQNLIRKPVLVLFCLAILLAFIGIQSAYYFLQTGNFWVDSYGEIEGFNFLDPQIRNVLFSFRKGLFVYTPLLLLVFPGFWYYYKREGFFSSITLFAVLSLFIYIVSSWWYWAYGGSFGMRPVIDFYPLFVIPIAAVVEVLYRKISGKVALLFILLAGVFLNLFQTWQYIESILPYEFMTRAKYAHLFLETKPHFKNIYLPVLTDKLFSKYKNTQLYSNDSISSEKKVIRILNVPGERKKVEFLSAPLVEIFKDTLMPPCWLEITAEFKVEDASTDASVITSIDTKNEPLSWFWKRNYIIHSMNVENEWKQITIRIDLPALKNPNDILSVSVINDLKSAVESRNVNIRLFSK